MKAFNEMGRFERYFLEHALKGVLCLFCAVLLYPQASFGQKLKSQIRHYSTADGLSHDGVLCMTRDREGFMWFGTWDGINRFDGSNFITYKARPGDRSSLRNNKIRNIIEDKKGYLWVKTYDNKVYRFDKSTEKFIAVTKTITGRNIEDIVIEKIIPGTAGETWLLTEAQGVLCVEQGAADTVLEVYAYNASGKDEFYLPSDKVNFLFEDSKGKIWVGTSAGLVCLEKRGGRFRQYLNFSSGKKSFGTNYTFKNAAEYNGHVYFGTDQGMLIEYNQQARLFKIKSITPGKPINALLASKQNRLYLSTNNSGLAILDLKTSVLSFKKMPGYSSFFSLYEDRTGNVWIEPPAAGVIKFDPGNEQFKLFVQKKEGGNPALGTKPVQDRTYSVFEDVNGVLWVSMKGGGFGYYDSSIGTIAYFYNEPQAADQQFSNVVSCFYSDHTGVLWLSTRYGGLHKAVFPGNSFSHQILKPNSSKPGENEVRAMFEDSSGRIWIAAKSGGLYVYRDGEPVKGIFTNLDQNALGSIYTIKEDRRGIIWIGTKGQGLFRAEPADAARSKFHLVRYVHNPADNSSISSNMIYSVLEDRKGRIWVGTFGGGLNLIVGSGRHLSFKNSRNSFRNYPDASFNVIRHLEESDDGKIWIAATDGLLRFDPDQGNPETYKFLAAVKVPGDPHSLGNNDVQFIYKDRQGQMWIGTFGGGLNRFIGEDSKSKQLRFEIYTREHGLPNDIILSITDDSHGNLWIATENGLSRLSVKNKSFQNYDSYDGLPRSGFSEAACFRSKSGRLYFGCINGFISFLPDKINRKKFNASIALTNLQLYNTDIAAGISGSPLIYALNSTDKVVLKHNQNVLSIDYSVLDYRAGHSIHYAYMLEGFDNEWHYVKNQKKATYSQLPPGDYVFKVKSVNKDFFNNTPQKSIAITILPPPWRTGWAYAGYFIIAVILLQAARRIITTMIRLRNRVVVEQKLTELKLQFFTNISHELRTPLTLIINPLRRMADSEKLSEKGLEYLHVVNKNANRMIRFINQLLDFRKIQSGKMSLKVSEVEVISFIRDIAGYFSETAREKNIRLLITSEENELYAWLDEEKMDIVIYNLLSNAFKFTPDNKTIEITIACKAGGEKFTISVKDEGTGVASDELSNIFELYYEGGQNHDNANKGTGIGLALSKEIILAHKGQISAFNNKTCGMTFVLELKTGKEHFSAKDLDEPQVAAASAARYTDLSVNLLKEQGVYQSAGDGKSTILIVEDNKDLRSFLVDQLVSAYRVLQAADGEEGLKIALEQLPDLIISDVMMPNMDGIQMLDKLKNDISTSHIPVILLTAKSSLENQIKGLMYGADFYITKPFHLEHITASVENLLRQRRKLYESLLNSRKVLKLEPGEVPITSKDEKFLKDVIAIVETNMADPQFNIDSVAEAAGMGRTTFYKKLKSLTNMSPVEFVRDIRLKRGRQLLDLGENTISEIAYMIGFSSSGYFSTCFKEVYKVSPSDYLKNQKENNVSELTDLEN